jgi:hypothetical protein
MCFHSWVVLVVLLFEKNSAFGSAVVLSSRGCLMFAKKWGGIALLALAFTVHAEKSNENLVLLPYPGTTKWHQVTDQREGNTFLWEFIPVNQEIERYKDILTAQAFPNNRKQSISSFVRSLFASVQGACKSVKVNGPKQGAELGYEIAYAQIYCSQQNGRDFGVHMFFKFIKGVDALYVVQREFRVPVTEIAGVTSFAKGEEKAAADMLKAVNTANDYLAHSVYLCAKNANEDRCAEH